MVTIIAIVAAVATAASVAYCILCVFAAARFAAESHRPGEVPPVLPPVSILKPLKGADPEMYETLRSYCVQDYPVYDIIFGVSSPDDPAAEVVRRLQKEFPHLAIQLIWCEKRLGANGKISSLTQMVPQARNEFLIVSDSDIRVDNHHLAQVMAELQQSGVGLVTCLYHGIPGNTLGSKIEATGISADFVPGVLAARVIEGKIKFGLGATLAFRRKELEQIGGFSVIADYLADDYELGRRIADSGFNIVLSRSIVATCLPAYGLGDFFTHQLRWARTIRAVRPAGYAGLLLTFTLPWAVLTLAVAGGAPWAWSLLAVAFAARFGMALAIGTWVLQDGHGWKWLGLLPVHDLLALATWFGGLFGRKIVWRGQVFRLKNGKMEAQAAPR